jgi:galactose-1-phosphate uridylyltransferase
MRTLACIRYCVSELLAEAQRDITPEQAAQRLRETSEQHYLENKK